MELLLLTELRSGSSQFYSDLLRNFRPWTIVWELMRHGGSNFDRARSYFPDRGRKLITMGEIVAGRKEDAIKSRLREMIERERLSFARSLRDERQVTVD